jgi:hypothetical protein
VSNRDLPLCWLQPTLVRVQPFPTNPRCPRIQRGCNDHVLLLVTVFLSRGGSEGMMFGWRGWGSGGRDRKLSRVRVTTCVALRRRSGRSVCRRRRGNGMQTITRTQTDCYIRMSRPACIWKSHQSPMRNLCAAARRYLQTRRQACSLSRTANSCLLTRSGSSGRIRAGSVASRCASSYAHLIREIVGLEPNKAKGQGEEVRDTGAEAVVAKEGLTVSTVTKTSQDKECRKMTRAMPV